MNGKWTIPYRVVGIDSNDKRMFMDRNGHWVEGKDSDTFSEAAANKLVFEINSRNRFLDLNDRVVAHSERAD